MNTDHPVFLLVDTSGPKLGCVIAKKDTMIHQVIMDQERDHCKNITRIMDQALRDTKLSLKDIDGFACIQGPGSFTGLRIGMMAVKTLAHIHQKPLMGLHTFERMASTSHAQDAQYLWPAQKNHTYATSSPLGSASQIAFGKTTDLLSTKASQVYYPQEMNDPALSTGTALPFEQICGTNVAVRMWQHWLEKDFLDTTNCHPLYVQQVAAKPNLKVK